MAEVAFQLTVLLGSATAAVDADQIIVNDCTDDDVLFCRYVVSVLELLVVENYSVIYFHAATSPNKVPALRWLKRCYDMTDHRLVLLLLPQFMCCVTSG